MPGPLVHIGLVRRIAGARPVAGIVRACFVKEIEEVMRAQKVKSVEISCEAGRFGNHWKYLGGARSLPIGCTIGKRSLGIDGTIAFLDARGKLIAGGMDNPKAFARARTAREKILTWKWSND
jgi:hypothetical protein